MLLADFEVQPSWIGIGVFVIIILLSFVERVRTFFWPKIATDQQNITKGELHSALKDYDRRIDETRHNLTSFATKIELQFLQREHEHLSTEHKELVKETRARYEDLSKMFSDLRLHLETIRSDVKVEIGSLKGLIVGQTNIKHKNSETEE